MISIYENIEPIDWSQPPKVILSKDFCWNMFSLLDLYFWQCDLKPINLHLNMFNQVNVCPSVHQHSFCLGHILVLKLVFQKLPDNEYILHVYRQFHLYIVITFLSNPFLKAMNSLRFWLPPLRRFRSLCHLMWISVMLAISCRIFLEGLHFLLFPGSSMQKFMQQPCVM